MDPYNLAICFGPTLVPIPEDKDQVGCFSYAVLPSMKFIDYMAFIIQYSIKGLLSFSRSCLLFLTKTQVSQATQSNQHLSPADFDWQNGLCKGCSVVILLSCLFWSSSFVSSKLFLWSYTSYKLKFDSCINLCILKYLSTDSISVFSSPVSFLGLFLLQQMISVLLLNLSTVQCSTELCSISISQYSLMNMLERQGNIQLSLQKYSCWKQPKEESCRGEMFPYIEGETG